ncbi:MAG: DUF4175 family protein [Chitinophagales bacterium]|nr:DUF4175 family protein [Chitinophagales bacterium]
MTGFNNYDLLIEKLDQFIRKYYLNQLLRGLIYASASILALFLIINTIEYFAYLPSLGRKILLFGFLSITAFITARWIVAPLVGYYRLGKIISHEQAAAIIGKHFSNVEDRLLNILQLKKQSASLIDQSLINASINQKIDQLKPVPFSAAIDLGNNRKYLKFLALPVLALVVILFAAPSILTEGTTRLIYSNTAFEKPAPFHFKVLNKELKTVQFSDIDLNVEVSGDALPDQVYIKQGGNQFKMQKKSATSYTYKFSNLQKNVDFVLSAVGFDSKEYTIQVVPKPMIIGFNIALDYPEYTGKKDEVVSNIGDLAIPAGTKVVWNFSTKDTRNLSVRLDDTIVSAIKGVEDHFTLVKMFKQSTNYTLKVSSDALKDADSITYAIAVTPDQYPTITVKPIEDTVAKQFTYFLGDISDDYGLTRLEMKYKVENGKGSNDYKTTAIPFAKGSKQSQFSYYWQTTALGLQPGDNVTYYFEVWDNDGVNGAKSARTSPMTFKLPSEEEMEKIIAESNDQVKDKLESTMDKAEKLQKDAAKMREKMLDKKNLSWDDQKSIENLVNQQKELKNEMEELQKEFEENTIKKENQAMSEELKEKQEKLKELFDQVMSDEMKELFEKLDSLMAQMDEKKDVLEQLEQFKMNDEQLQKELDRMLSLFKQLELEQKLNETVKDLNKLAEEQQKLAEESEKKNDGSDELAKQQEDLNKKFDDIKKDVEELKELSKEAQQEMAFEKPEEEMKQADQKMSDSQQSLLQNKNKKASESQKGAAKDMQEMAQLLQEMQNEMQMDQMELDLKTIRQLLENLVQLSFDQEQLMDRLRNTNINGPEYVKLMQEQKNIRDDAEMVEDSLYALAKRVVQIESFVTNEIKEIKKHIGKGIKSMEDRNKSQASVSQQYVMTGFNNLALMLSEAMDQMQQQMQQQMQGTGACQKPGNNKKPGMSMSQMQKQLNEQLQKMMEGQKPGQKPGDKAGQNGSMSKELAQAAAKQKAIRDALKKLNDAENKDGKGSLGDLNKLMEEMDKTETDLVNKKLTSEMIKRQQEILTRLLETEDALKERETDKERKSQSGQEIVRTLPPSLEEYLKKREAEIQLYKTVPPALKPYYKNLVENYFKGIGF